MKVTVSVGFTPKSSVVSKRVDPNAPDRQSTTQSNVSTIAFFMI
jgi:hypothetical protein